MTVLLFIAVLFVLVLVHELGHFLAARRGGMRVDEFGIGFPPKLFGIKKGETLYSINAVPLGGFVKIYGEDSDQEDSAPELDRSFNRRPFIWQAVVLVAGVTANVLLAWFLFAIVFTVGMQTSVDEREASGDAKLMVLSVLPGSPADIAGVKPGEVIVTVSGDGRGAEELLPSTVSSFIASQDRVVVETTRGDSTYVHELTAVKGLAPDNAERPVVGITMGLVERVSMPVHQAIYESGLHTIQSIGAIAVGIAGLIHDAVLLKADFSNVAGPVGIAGLVGDAASVGWTSLLVFTAFISLNLAVINMLPFPALDGGRLLMVVIEAIKGSPFPPRLAQGLNAIGFIALLLLMVLVTYNDILRLIG